MIFYFSGTGNSYAVAMNIAKRMQNEKMVPLAKFKDYNQCKNESRIGIVFPCYMGAAPKVVKQFKEALFKNVDTSNIYVYAVITYNHSDAATYLEFKDNIDAWFRVRMPQSDIYNSRAAEQKAEEKILAEAAQKIEGFAEDIRHKRHTVMYKKIPGMATLARAANQALMYKDMGSKIYSDGNCIGCGQCVKFCPMGNITFENELIWGNRCESCFGCINRCPKGAIQFGKRTIGKARYINPEYKGVYD